MAQITTTISQYTGVVPNKDTLSPVEFDNAVDSLLLWWLNLVSSINNWAGEANVLRDDVNNLQSLALAYKNQAEQYKNEASNYKDIAVSSANYKGEWSSSVNYDVGDTVSRLGSFFRCAVNNTGIDPLTDQNSWKLVDDTNTMLGLFEVFSLASMLEKQRDLFNKALFVQGEVTITSSGANDIYDVYPYVDVALPFIYPSSSYLVDLEVVDGVPSIDFVGNVRVINKATNGFRIIYTGSATSATVKYMLHFKE